MSVLSLARNRALSAEYWTSGDEVESGDALYPFSPHPFFFFPPPGVFRQRKAVFLAVFFFYLLVYLRSMPYPQAPQHRTVPCPQLIDKTCSAVCCTH